MNAKFLTLTGLSMVLLASCSQPSVSDAKAKFCKNLGELEQAVVKLQNLGPDSKVGDLKSAQKDVEKAVTDVKESAVDLREAKVDQLDQAYTNLDKEVNSIPNKATLAEAQASIQEEVNAVVSARQQLFSSVNCAQ